MFRSRNVAQIVALITLILALFHVPAAHAQEDSKYFPETKQTIKGRFLEYWNNNGGVMQQGFPISPELQEVSVTDGKTYTVQYFERAVFEKHPENARPYDVLLSLLGVAQYNQKYPGGAPGQRPNTEAGSIFFPQTGKRIGGSFLVYFNQFGGVPQQGLPISDEFQERSDLDGKVRVVQYFERAVFEWNPSNTPPFNVLLAQLGTFAYKARTQTPAPEPALLEPALPAPLDSSKRQYSPMAAGRYLVWGEGLIGGPYGQFVNGFDIRALDLATNKPILVADGPSNQIADAIDGSLVAWRSYSPVCALPCPAEGVYATDLATGKRYDIAVTRSNGSPAVLRDPVVAGRYIAGISVVDAVHESIVAKNVDNGAQVVAYTSELSANDSVIGNLRGNGRFLVWSESSYDTTSSSARPFRIYTYDLATGTLSRIYEAAAGSQTPDNHATYSLNGGKLVLSDGAGSLTLMDLVNHTQVDILVDVDVTYLQLYGNRLLIGTTSYDLAGLDLAKPEQGTVKLLEPLPGTSGPNLPGFSATVAGDWLVWSDWKGPAANLAKKKLDLAPVVDPARVSSAVLPKPEKYRSQNVAGGYGSIVIYWDCPVAGHTNNQPACRLRGFDRNTGTENTYVPGLTPEQAVEVMVAPGGLLVWRLASPPDCMSCPRSGIYAVDLYTGTSYEVATGLTSRYSVAAYGRTVMWIEKDAGSERIMGKNLDTGQVTNYRQIATSQPVLSTLRLSDVFVVWNEQDTEHLEGKKSSIMRLNTQTGELSTIYAYDWNSNTAQSLRISLDVSRVAIRYGDAFLVLNLRTNERIELNVAAHEYIAWMQLNDNVLIYASTPYYPAPNSAPISTSVYALPLDEPTKVFTILSSHAGENASYVGVFSQIDLIYSDITAQRSQLHATRLPYELMNREK